VFVVAADLLDLLGGDEAVELFLDLPPCAADSCHPWPPVGW
jgi:hypothetical protein